MHATTNNDIIRTAIKVMCLVAATAIAACTSQAPDANNSAPAAQSVVQIKRDYALINGLKMYFENHGSGRPLVLLHGGFGVAESWAPMLPALTKSRQVVIVEQQGHGRTADRDGPLTYSQMVEDTSALLRELKISAADVFGYSDGGIVAVGLAIARRPGAPTGNIRCEHRQREDGS